MRKKILSFTEMKQGTILFFLCAATIIGVVACSKGGTAASDPHISDFSDSTTPVVDLYTPADNQVFSNGDTIKIDGKVTDNSLYQGSIRITNDVNGALLKEQLYEIHGFQLYNFHIEYKVNVTAVSDFTVTVQYLDHGLNSGIKTAKVKANP